MEDRYTIELRERDPSKIDQLYLDNCKSTSVKGLGDNLVTLDTLSMVNCGLESLEGLPLLPELVILDVSQNKLNSGLDIIAQKCPKLQKLVISDNKFSDFDQLAPLKDIESLAVIDTFQNEVENTDGYRDKMFDMLPNLHDLDGHDVNGEVTEELDDEETGVEDAEDSDNDESSDGEEDDGPGLSYLQRSNILEDEDETEDYDAEDVDEAEEGAPEAETTTRRGVKRRHQAGDDEESNQ